MDETNTQGGGATAFVVTLVLGMAAIMVVVFGVIPQLKARWTAEGAKSVTDCARRASADPCHYKSDGDAPAEMREGTYLAPGGYIEEGGVHIQVGRLYLTDSDAKWSTGLVPMFVTKAPDKQPVGLTCIFLDRNGVLLGGGGGDIRPYSGTLVSFAFVGTEPGHVKCKVLK